MTDAEYTARVARVIQRSMAVRPTLDELIESGKDLDSRVHLPVEGDWESLQVPEDLAPGE
jgi:hypothetical protein